MMWIWKTDWLEMHNSCVLIFRMRRGLCIYNFSSLGGGLDDSWWLSPAGSSGDSMRRWEHRGPGQKAGSVNTQRGTVLLWNRSWSLKADAASNYKLFMEYQLYFTCLHQFLYYYFLKLCFTLCMFFQGDGFFFPPHLLPWWIMLLVLSCFFLWLLSFIKQFPLRSKTEPAGFPGHSHTFSCSRWSMDEPGNFDSEDSEPSRWVTRMMHFFIY